MPVRALRPYTNRYKVRLCRLKTMNARKGIKTHYRVCRDNILIHALKTMNARKGIKTGQIGVGGAELALVKNNECP